MRATVVAAQTPVRRSHAGSCSVIADSGQAQLPVPGQRAHYLKLDGATVRGRLGWLPRRHLERALESIVAWHRAHERREDMQTVCLRQIDEYVGGGA